MVLATPIEQNENKILKFMHEIEEKKGQSLSIDTKSIQKGTDLTPHQINTALALLSSEGFLYAYEGIDHDEGHDYNCAIITPKGKLRAEKMNIDKETVEKSKNPRNVFVVFGRNYEVHDAMFDFLRSLDLFPQDFDEYENSIKKGNPYIGEVLDKAFDEAQAIVVLITPDDEGRLLEPFRKADDPTYEKELTPQGRLNVIFEAGMAMGRCSDRTILVEIGKVRPFSDVAGRHMLRFEDTAEKRLDLAMRLEGAGCKVKRDGKGWLRAGKLPKKPDNGSVGSPLII